MSPKPRKTEKATGSTGQNIFGIIGRLVFAVGVILALICGLVSRGNVGIILTLIVLGIIVAVLNLAARDVIKVMVAAIAVIVAGYLSDFLVLNTLVNELGTSLNSIARYLAVLMVPVAIISAIRAVIATGRNGD